VGHGPAADANPEVRAPDRALAAADRGYVLELGKNRFEGTGDALLTDPEVKRLYLGG